MGHLDIDDDGTSDALDIHFRFDVKTEEHQPLKLKISV